MFIINENITFTHYAFGIQLPDWSKLAANLKNSNDVTIFQNDVLSILFYVFCFSSQVTGPSFRVMTSSFYKGLTRNPEIVHTSNMFGFCPISGDCGN